MEQTEQKEELAALKDRVINRGINISRIPQKKKKRFLQLAKDEFADDYGMCLSFLLEFFDVFAPSLSRLDNFEIRLLEIEKQLSGQKEEKGVKLLSGKTIGEKNGKL